MKRPGRKSAEAKAALTLVDLSHFRPDPPSHLTKDEQQIWRDIVGSMKPGSFAPSTYPLLELYCNHIIRCRFIAAKLHKTDIKKNFREFKALASMQCSETSAMCQLAVKLRLLPKTNTRAERQMLSETSTPWNIRRRLWERDDNDDGGKPAA